MGVNPAAPKYREFSTLKRVASVDPRVGTHFVDGRKLDCYDFFHIWESNRLVECIQLQSI